MGGLFHKLRHPRRCYAVCTIPRSGSNLLTDGLHATRRAGRPKQFFLRTSVPHFAALHRLTPAGNFGAYIRDIAKATATSNEVFGFKLMSWYLDDFLGRLRNTGVFGGTDTSDLDLLRNAFRRLQFVRIGVNCGVLSKARAVHTIFGKCRKVKAPSDNRGSTRT
jgi:LPS sulfotransferase NodH